MAKRSESADDLAMGSPHLGSSQMKGREPHYVVHGVKIILRPLTPTKSTYTHPINGKATIPRPSAPFQPHASQLPCLPFKHSPAAGCLRWRECAAQCDGPRSVMVGRSRAANPMRHFVSLNRLQVCEDRRRDGGYPSCTREDSKGRVKESWL